MNSKIYRQADSRWGSLPYPTKAYSFAHNGCGCCAVTHCAIELPQYANYTPADVRKFMVQYATKGHGTLWNGITKGLEHYGYNVHWRQKDTMSDIYKVLEKSLRRGVILFGSSKGGSQKITWTTGGHYVAFVNAKYENGDWWFYMKDSGGRKHDGWYSYRKHMAGDVRNVWICTSLKNPPKPTPVIPKPTGKYSGVIPSPTIKNKSKGENVKNLQRFLNWYGNFKLTVDGSCGAKTVSAIKEFQRAEGITADGIYGSVSQSKAKAYAQPAPYLTSGDKAVAWARSIINGGQYKYKKWNDKDKKTKQCPICHKLTGKYKGWNCIGFVSACYYHGAGNKNITCSCSGIGTNSFFTKVTESSWAKRNGSGWQMITNGGSKGGKSIDVSKLKVGDVLIGYNSKGQFHHISIYSGNGKIMESTATRKPNVGERTYKDLCGRHHITRAFRYVR